MSVEPMINEKSETNVKTGLPVVDEEIANANKSKGKLKQPIFILIRTAIGYGIAYAIYALGDKTKYDARIAMTKEFDLQWFMLAIVAFSWMVMWLNGYPTCFKEAVMNGMSGGANLRSNMQIYKLATDTNNEGSAVILHTEGDLGRYNRANRSIYHFLENCLGLVIALPLTFFMFPIPSFVLVCISCLGRIIYQVGYTGGYGKHALGYMLDSTAKITVLGLIILAYTKIVF